MEDVRAFLETVLPWPAPEEDGFISLHTSDNWPGVAVRTMDEFMKELGEARERTTDIYVCCARQKEAKPNGGLHMVPIRKGFNADRYKAVWVDWDAGEDKQFKTTEEAAVGLKKFLADSGLPGPSAIVASGSGGFHVWWASDRPLIKGVWEMYARGLRALLEKHGFEGDVGCTTDFVRILRVPYTVNCKWSPPRPVMLMGLGKKYDFEKDLSSLVLSVSPGKGGVSYALPGKLPAIPARFQGRKDAITVADDHLPPGFPPMPAEQIRQCLERIPNDKVNWDRWNTVGMRIYAACEGEEYGLAEWQWWSDQLVDDGKDSCEARWNTYHMSPPTRTGAGALVNEVRRITGDERWLPALGGIPFKKKEDDSGWMLPDGYRLKNSRIERKVAPKKKKGDDDDDPDDVESPWVPFIKSEIIGKPWAQKNPDGLHMEIRIDVASTRKVFLARTDCTKTKVCQTMSDRGIWYEWKTQPTVFEGFFMDWIGRMNSYVAASEKSKLGWEWEDENALPSAFVYGGYRFTNKGTREPVGATDEKIRREYFPQGTREVWDEAAKLVFNQKRPVLEIIVAASLAGPLMQFTGLNGAMLSVYSSGTGAHKSTASMIGAAIFGHPVQSRESTGSTHKGTVKRLGDVQNLTVQWDDIQEEAHLKIVSQTAFQCSQGSGGTKLKQDRTYHDTGHWKTLLCSYSNHSFVDYIVRKEPNNAAELSRVFEIYHRIRNEDKTGLVDGGYADRILGELERNFGRVGLEYAELLANNVEEVRKLVIEEGDKFRAAVAAAEIETDTGNRCWFGVCAILLAGARLGQQLNIPFDYDSIRTTLVEAFRENVNRRTDEAVDGESPLNTENALNEFLNKYRATNILWSRKFAQRGGFEDKIDPLGSPPVGRPVWVHFSTHERKMRISKKAFGEALREEKRSPSVVWRGLAKHFGADMSHKCILGAGSQFAGTQEKVIELSIPEGSPYEAILFAHQGRLDEQL